MRIAILVCGWLSCCTQPIFGQDVNALVAAVRTKLEKVNSYEGLALMKTNVSYLKVPDAQVRVYYQKPDKIKIINEHGISLVPKGTMAISLSGLFSGGYTALDAGTEKIKGISVRVVKLLPLDNNAEVVLSTLYIDPARSLILKANTTTRDSGSYEVDMVYGKYMDLGLPEKVTCIFNIKEYSLPKGITFDYDDGTKRQTTSRQQTKGSVELLYSSYLIDKKIPISIF